MIDRDALLSTIEGQSSPDGLVEAIVAALSVQAPTALARATALLAWKIAFEAEHGSRRHGGDRKSAAYREAIKSKTCGFDRVAGGRLGLSEEAIRLDVRLAEDLGPRDIARLWDTGHARNALALRTYARLNPADRDAAYALIAADAALSMSQVLAAIGGKAASDEQARLLSTIQGLFGRLTAASKRRLAADLAGDAEFRRAFLATTDTHRRVRASTAASAVAAPDANSHPDGDDEQAAA